MLAAIDNPTNKGNQFDGLGYDPAVGYIPMSLQYGTYTADGAHVRRHSIAHDEGEDRNYYGKTAEIINATDLDSVTYGRKCADVAAQSGKKLPVITMAYFDILMGRFEPQGLLPMQQPKDMDAVEAQKEDVPRDMTCYTDSEGHTYDFAYGLNWKGVIKDARTAKYGVPALHVK